MSEIRLVVRGMKICDVEGKPLIGSTARELGVRVPQDIIVDSNGYVEAGTYGMSVSPLPVDNLPKHRRPKELGGTGKDPLWLFDTIHLASFNLTYVPDPKNPAGHGFIAPSFNMTYNEYVRQIHNTQSLWDIYRKED